MVISIILHRISCIVDEVINWHFLFSPIFSCIILIRHSLPPLQWKVLLGRTRMTCVLLNPEGSILFSLSSIWQRTTRYSITHFHRLVFWTLHSWVFFLSSLITQFFNNPSPSWTLNVWMLQTLVLFFFSSSSNHFLVVLYRML